MTSCESFIWVRLQAWQFDYGLW